jgi:hypothetical protein
MRKKVQTYPVPVQHFVGLELALQLAAFVLTQSVYTFTLSVHITSLMCSFLPVYTECETLAVRFNFVYTECRQSVRKCIHFPH